MLLFLEGARELKRHRQDREGKALRPGAQPHAVHQPERQLPRRERRPYGQPGRRKVALHLRLLCRLRRLRPHHGSGARPGGHAPRHRLVAAPPARLASWLQRAAPNLTPSVPLSVHGEREAAAGGEVQHAPCHRLVAAPPARLASWLPRPDIGPSGAGCCALPPSSRPRPPRLVVGDRPPQPLFQVHLRPPPPPPPPLPPPR